MRGGCQAAAKRRRARRHWKAVDAWGQVRHPCLLAKLRAYRTCLNLFALLSCQLSHRRCHNALMAGQVAGAAPGRLWDHRTRFGATWNNVRPFRRAAVCMPNTVWKGSEWGPGSFPGWTPAGGVQLWHRWAGRAERSGVGGNHFIIACALVRFSVFALRVSTASSVLQLPCCWWADVMDPAYEWHCILPHSFIAFGGVTPVAPSDVGDMGAQLHGAGMGGEGRLVHGPVSVERGSD